MLEFHKDFSQGWVLTLLSSALCVLGCFIIYTDDVYYLLFPRWFTRRYPFLLGENYSFMNGSLSFSSGCLLFTALYRLLPEAMKYFKNSNMDSGVNGVLILSFGLGILTCVAFNEALHYFTAESVVHCSHDGEPKTVGDDLEAAHSHSHKHGHGEHDHHASHFSGANDDEIDPLQPLEHEADDGHDAYDGVRDQPSEHVPLLGHRKSSRLLHIFSHDDHDMKLLGECKGYLSAERCLHQGSDLHFCEIPQLETAPDADTAHESDESGATVHETAPVAHYGSHNHSHANSHGHNHHSHSHAEDHSLHTPSEHHHHHVNLPLSRLLLIGIQTILALTLHKLPEGFITYITSETNPQLGVLIFLSLLIHNYTEGFSMCLPLYYSFSARTRFRKLKAVLVSALLGGLSQPLGAAGGYLFLRYYAGDSLDLDRLNQVFGISMAVTSGFLVVIALLMYGSAVSFSGLPNFVMLWCLMGMGVIGLLTVFIASD